MLQFLNNQQNKKERPNENFAREMLELFTLGRGNYTETDVKEAACALFSEFGRRVTQNASGGTDHGTANNVFLLSGALRKPGLLNAPASLADLDQGDLRYQVDFRSLYASILSDWLGADDKLVLGPGLEHLAGLV